MLVGGGGGNEIANKIMVYDLSDKGNQLPSNVLGKPVHEESTGQDVPNYIDTAMNINVVAACMGPFTAIYKIEPKKGELILF